MPGMFLLLLEAAVNKWKTLPETVVDLTGRTVIVTGSNVGLGLEAAKRFYAMSPARLILAVRTISKGEEARKAILGAGYRPSPHGSSRDETKIDVWHLDLSSFESVKQFANKCENELERIDILLENAAVVNPGWSVTKDGWESDLQVNLLSTFLLAALVAPLIAKTAKLPAPIQGPAFKPHLVVVVSDAHYIAPLRARNESSILGVLNDQARYVQNDRYADTKAISIMLTQELAKHPLLKDVVVCSVNPGFCRSELLREWPVAVRFIMYGLFARTTAEGSKNYTWASLSSNIPPGVYTSSCAVTPSVASLHHHTVVAFATLLHQSVGPLSDVISTRRPGGVVTSQDSDRIRSQLWKETATILIKEAPQAETFRNF